MHVARMKKVSVPELEVTAEVALTPVETGFALLVSMNPVFTGISLEVANELVTAAHRICPYSNAIKNNVDVNITVEAK